MIQLNPMTTKDFDQFYERLLIDYTKDTVLAFKMDHAEASEFANKQIKEMLAQGQKTPQNEFYTIVDENFGSCGQLWLLLKENKNSKTLFIADIFIYEGMRGKKIGSRVLKWVDDHARKLGCSSVSLHVFGHNLRAYELYKKSDFHPYSIGMRKEL